MKVGMISFAHMHAYSYAECLKAIPEVELVGVTDDNGSRGQEAAERFGTRYYQDMNELLATDVDAVVICNENINHKDAVIAAAKAKKHILCEKPIATTIEDAKAMIEACETNGVKLQIAFPCRYNAPIRRVKQMLDEGRLGRILAMRGTNRGQNPGGWFIDQALSGGGAVLDHTVHVLDLMRWFMNSEVKEVYAEVDTRFYDIPIDDCGLLTLEFENGVFASHDPSWSRCRTFPTWGDVTIEIIGTKGNTRVDAMAQHLTLFQDSSRKVSHVGWANDMDAGLIEDFVRCVTEDTEPTITGFDGLKAMEVALCAYQSAKTRQPVRLG